MRNNTDFNNRGAEIGKYQKYAASHACAGTCRSNFYSGCIDQFVIHHR
jgi:hypothetical protein